MSKLTTSNELPKLRAATIKTCQKQQLNFSDLYETLRCSDPVAAQWLQDATEYIAPANPLEKEKYARLALELYYLLLIESTASAA